MTSRLVALPVVIALAAATVAVGLAPAASGLGAAIGKIDEVFFGDPSDAVEIPEFPQRSTIYAADGSHLASVADENRAWVPLSGINAFTRQAVLAIEDDRFYQHGPVDIAAIGRAALANLRAGRIVQGGSTLSQQLVKNTTTGGEQTFQRKFREAQAAIRLERQYTKDQILELYLNQVYFGNGAYGIKAAAEWYFGKEPRALTLPEAALLAGLIASPATFDPVDHRDAARARRDQVLDRMHQLAWIDGQQHAEAIGSRIKLSKARRHVNKLGKEPYFVQYVKDQILHPDEVFARDDPRRARFLKVFGKTYEDRARSLFQGGLKIYTTLVPQMQEWAEEAVETRLPNQGPAPPADPQAAVVTIVPDTGAIQTMYGGANFSKQKFNLATQSRRTAGSAFKAFTLAAALARGVPVGKVYTATSGAPIPQSDCPNQGGPWMPANAEPSEGGAMSMTTATALSVNAYFAQLIADVGPEHVEEVAKRMGVRSYARNAPVVVEPVCAITLGAVQVNPLSMTSGFATLANDGKHCLPFAIRKVVDSRGKTLFRAGPVCEQVIEPGIAAQVTALLEGVITDGTATIAQLGRPVAGKTGTGQDYQDAWFIGYVPQMVTGVWVGYSKALISMRSLPVLGYRNAFGGSIAAPIWKDFMARSVTALPVEEFPVPPPPKTAPVPDVTGKTVAEAQAILQDADFTMFVEETPSDLPKGLVANQSPGAGAEVPLGSAVTVYVSTGVPPRAQVPDAIGRTVRAATNLLIAKGFEVSLAKERVFERSLDGIVIAQSPGAGARVKPGSRVTIVVGEFDGSGKGGEPGDDDG